MPQSPPQLVKATLTALPKGDVVTVHFNPASLSYSVENSLAQQSGAPKKAQYVAQFSGKLSMELQFDTTSTGSNVRNDTSRVALFMQASGNASASASNAAAAKSNGNTSGPPPKAPPVLLFQWGVYSFQGIMDSYKETIDFFSAEGIPLRALVSISLSRQDDVFDENFSLSKLFGSIATASVGSTVPSALSDSAYSMAKRGGSGNAARQLAADNNLDSMRFTNGAPMQVGSGVQLNPPAAFVTAPSTSGGGGLGLGFSAGASGGTSFGGSGAGVSAGFSAGCSIMSGMAPAFGASASAGVSATAGAFAGLQTGRATISSTANLNPLQMVPATVGTDVATFSGASFSLGGAANNTGSAGLSSDVGTKFNFSDRLIFSRDD